MKNFALLLAIVFLFGCKFKEPKTYTVIAPGPDGSISVFENLTLYQEGSTWCEFKKDGKKYTFVGTYVFIEE